MKMERKSCSSLVVCEFEPRGYLRSGVREVEDIASNVSDFYW